MRTLFRLAVVLPVKVAVAFLSLPVLVLRRAGWRLSLGFALGLAAGFAVLKGRGVDAAPVVVDDATLEDRVRFELAHGARTWHRIQPEVAVVDGCAVLRGAIDADAARAMFTAVAAAVPGVRAVRDELVVGAVAPR